MYATIEAGIPVVGTCTFPDDEESIRIVDVFDSLQFIIMAPEEGFLPIKFILRRL